MPTARSDRPARAAAEPVPSAIPLQAAAGAEGAAAGAMLVLRTRALAQGRCNAAATSALADLARLLAYERMSLGLLEGPRARVVAISGVLDLRQQQDTAQHLAHVMREALVQRSAIVHPLPAETTLHDAAIHAALAHGNGQLSICILPALCADRPGGALLFERPQGLDAIALRAAEDTALFVAPVPVLKRRTRRRLRAAWEEARQRLPAMLLSSPASLIARAALQVRALVRFFSAVRPGFDRRSSTRS